MSKYISNMHFNASNNLFTYLKPENEDNESLIFLWAIVLPAGIVTCRYP